MITPHTFSQLTIDPAGWSSDWTRGYQVFVSNDAIDWGAPVASGTGSAGVLTIVFPTQSARFIGIVQTGSSSNWWSIGEINVYGSGTTGTFTPVATALPRVGWAATASSSCGSDVPANALDDNASTRWSTGSNQTSGMFFQVDMLTVRSFTRITLDAGSSNGDYARAYSVYASQDGTHWGSSIANGTGTAQLVTINFPLQNARYIKVVLTTSNATNWWSIAELNVYGIAPYLLLRDGWVANASLSTSAAGNGIDGRFSSRWTTNVNQANGQWYELDMLAKQTFNQITLDAVGNSSDYPRGYQVFVSNDGATWGNPVATGTGSASMVSIGFPAQTARYISGSADRIGECLLVNRRDQCVRCVWRLELFCLPSCRRRRRFGERSLHRRFRVRQRGRHEHSPDAE
jgi:hypothetical protein